MRKVFRLIFIIFTLLIVSIFSFFFAYANEKQVFPLSTEPQIGKIRNLIERAPENGIYISVGGERAFRGASMYSTIDHLIIFDISPDIKQFNSINSFLLKAKNKESYKHLRWYSKFSEWKKVDAKLKEKDFDWWDKNIRNPHKYTDSEWFNKMDHLCNKNPQEKYQYIYDLMPEKTPINIKTIVESSDIIDYKSGNYLFNDKLYARLHKLAVNNKIKVIQMDLRNSKDQKLLIEVIQKINNKIAVLDLDNLYEELYMGEKKFKQALDSLISYGLSDSSILIIMSVYQFPESLRGSLYVGFTFANVKLWDKEPFLNNFFKYCSGIVRFFIDGRLYEKNESLPLYLNY